MSGDDDSVFHRDIDVTRNDPSVEITMIVAERESKEPDELTSIWRVIGGVLEKTFSTPPSPEADLEVSFTYEGYRVTVEQSGRATFVHLD